MDLAQVLGWNRGQVWIAMHECHLVDGGCGGDEGVNGWQTIHCGKAQINGPMSNRFIGGQIYTSGMDNAEMLMSFCESSKSRLTCSAPGSSNRCASHAEESSK
jgi:hypothetical protein